MCHVYTIITQTDPRHTAASQLYVCSVVEVKVTVFTTTTLDIKRKEIEVEPQTSGDALKSRWLCWAPRPWIIVPVL